MLLGVFVNQQSSSDRTIEIYVAAVFSDGVLLFGCSFGVLAAFHNISILIEPTNPT